MKTPNVEKYLAIQKSYNSTTDTNVEDDLIEELEKVWWDLTPEERDFVTGNQDEPW